MVLNQICLSGMATRAKDGGGDLNYMYIPSETTGGALMKLYRNVC